MLVRRRGGGPKGALFCSRWAIEWEGSRGGAPGAQSSFLDSRLKRDRPRLDVRALDAGLKVRFVQNAACATEVDQANVVEPLVHAKMSDISGSLAGTTTNGFCTHLSHE